jgi:hypothetical protein
LEHRTYACPPRPGEALSRPPIVARPMVDLPKLSWWYLQIVALAVTGARKGTLLSGRPPVSKPLIENGLEPLERVGQNCGHGVDRLCPRLDR